MGHRHCVTPRIMITQPYRRKFRSQSSDNMDRWKSRGWKSQRRERKKKKQRRERVRRKNIKVHVFVFQCFVAPEGRKVGFCGAIWGMRDRKLHGVVARSRFASQNAKNTSLSDTFWKLRCRKSACCCGAKHLSKSKCEKHSGSGALLDVETSNKCTPLWHEAQFEVKSKVLKTDGLGPFLEVEMSKKCTLWWREAHSDVKSAKNWLSRTTWTFGRWDVIKVHAVVTRSTFAIKKCWKLAVSGHFWTFRCRKSEHQHQHQQSHHNSNYTTTTTWHYKTLQDTSRLYKTLQQPQQLLLLLLLLLPLLLVLLLLFL